MTKYFNNQIIGRESDDIDIAIDSMYGEDLAKLVYENCKIDKRIGIVECNPEQSKHLKTAIISLCGVSIDLVNLRSETYCDDSRIPNQKIGTPLEDAQRRDLTINSLYYNINDGQIEDFLGNGIDDMRNGIIRTPLDPYQTFVDDPLRILRVIRFAVRFQFSFVSEILDAFKNPTLKDHLQHKISNERIKKELDSVFKGCSASAAINILYDYDLLETCLKSGISEERPFREALGMACHIDRLLGETNAINELIKENRSELQQTLYYCSLALPFKHYKGKIGKKEHQLSVVIARESLKLTNENVNLIVSLIQYLPTLRNIVFSDWNRVDAGILVRDIDASNLATFCILGLATELVEQEEKKEMDREAIESRYFEFVNFLEKENLTTWSKKEVLVTVEI